MKVSKWIFVLVVPLLLLLGGERATADAQSVVIVKSDNKPYYNETVDGFKARLKSLGSFQILEVDLAGSSKNAPYIDAALAKASGSKVVFTVGTGASKLAYDKVKGSSPLVYSLVANPSKYGLKGEENVSGIAFDFPAETVAKRIKAIFGPVTVGVIHSPGFKGKYSALATAAKQNGIKTVGVPINDPKELLKAFDTLQSKGVKVLVLFKDKKVLAGQNTNVLLEEALKNRMGVIGFTENHVQRGALMAFTTDYTQLGQQAADTAQKMLSGNGGGFLFPQKIRVVLNKKVQARLSNLPLAQESIKNARVL